MSDMNVLIYQMLRDIRERLTRLSTYHHVIRLEPYGIAVSAAVSGVLGLLKKTIGLAGTIGATSNVTGTFNCHFFEGSINAVSGAAGNLDRNPSCIGDVIGSSGASAELNRQPGYAGSSAGVVTVDAMLAIMQ